MIFSLYLSFLFLNSLVSFCLLICISSFLGVGANFLSALSNNNNDNITNKDYDNNNYKDS